MVIFFSYYNNTRGIAFIVPCFEKKRKLTRVIFANQVDF